MTRNRKAAKKDSTLPNPLTGGKKPPMDEEAWKEAVSRIIGLLENGKTAAAAKEIIRSPEIITHIAKMLFNDDDCTDENAGMCFAEALKKAILASGKGRLSAVDRSAAIFSIGKALYAMDAEVRDVAAQSLGEAANKGIDVSPAIPALLHALADDDEYVQGHAGNALKDSVLDEKCRGNALPALIDALYSTERLTRTKAAGVMGNAAARGDRGCRNAITTGLIALMRSEKFQKEMYENSVAYTNAMEGIDWVFKRMTEAERA